MIITITGRIGSGKTEIGKKLAEKLGYKFYSIGDLRGKMAVERGLTITELNKLGEKQDFTDRDVDEYQEILGETEDNIIVEGKLSWHFIPNSLKVFVDVDEETGARRVLDAKREDEEYTSFEEAMEKVRERNESDRKRYKKYYGIEDFGNNSFDVVINTTNLNQEEALTKLYSLIKEKKPFF